MVALVVAGVSIGISIAAAVFAGLQWREIRKSTTVAVLIPFRSQYHSDRFKQFRHALYESRVDVEHLSAEDRATLESLLDQLEFIGALWRIDVVPLEVIKATFPHSPLKCWPRVLPYIQQKTTDSPHYAEAYEQLVLRYNPNIQRVNR